jgi:hypothetical protein
MIQPNSEHQRIDLRLVPTPTMKQHHGLVQQLSMLRINKSLPGEEDVS